MPCGAARPRRARHTYKKQKKTAKFQSSKLCNACTARVIRTRHQKVACDWLMTPVGVRPLENTQRKSPQGLCRHLAEMLVDPWKKVAHTHTSQHFMIFKHTITRGRREYWLVLRSRDHHHDAPSQSRTIFAHILAAIRATEPHIFVLQWLVQIFARHAQNGLRNPNPGQTPFVRCTH